MNQIRSDEIIHSDPQTINKTSALPRDFERTGFVGEEEIQEIPVNQMVSSSNLTNGSRVPETPAILSVVSQEIRFGPDGKAIVDIILEIEDVANAVEYDVRVTKSAGNL